MSLFRLLCICMEFLMDKVTRTGLRSSGMLRGIGWPFVADQQSTPRDTPEERRHHLHRGRSLKSRITRTNIFLLPQHFAFLLSVVIPTVHHIQSSVQGMDMCPGPVSRDTTLSTVTKIVNCKYGVLRFVSTFRIFVWLFFPYTPTIHNYSQCPEYLRQNCRLQTCTNEQMLSWTTDIFVELTYGADSSI